MAKTTNIGFNIIYIMFASLKGRRMKWEVNVESNPSFAICNCFNHNESLTTIREGSVTQSLRGGMN